MLVISPLDPYRFRSFSARVLGCQALLCFHFFPVVAPFHRSCGDAQSLAECLASHWKGLESGSAIAVRVKESIVVMLLLLGKLCKQGQKVREGMKVFVCFFGGGSGLSINIYFCGSLRTDYESFLRRYIAQGSPENQ